MFQLLRWIYGIFFVDCFGVFLAEIRKICEVQSSTRRDVSPPWHLYFEASGTNCALAFKTQNCWSQKVLFHIPAEAVLPDFGLKKSLIRFSKLKTEQLSVKPYVSKHVSTIFLQLDSSTIWDWSTQLRS